jgi:hypothetical protein
MANKMVYKGSRLKVRLSVKDEIFFKALVIKKYITTVQKTDNMISQPKSDNVGINVFAGENKRKKGSKMLSPSQPPAI